MRGSKIITIKKKKKNNIQIDKKMFYITRYAGIFFNQDVLYFWQLSLIDKKSDTVVVLRYSRYVYNGNPQQCVY